LERAKKWAKDADNARRAKTQPIQEEENHRNEKQPKFIFHSFAWRFEPDALSHLNKDFKPRDLNDTRYLCRVARDYLSYICKGFTRGKEQRHPNVLASNGAMTDIFKSIWGINECLPTDYDKWAVQKWQRDLMADKIREKLLYEKPDKYNLSGLGQDESKKAKELLKEDVDAKLEEMADGEFIKISSRKKDRTNHYHHALDAFAIGCMNNSIVQQINSMTNEIEIENKKHNENPQNADHQETIHQTRKRLIANNQKYKMPFVGFDKDGLSKKLANLIVSEKQAPDKLEQFMNEKSKGFAKLTLDTAYGFPNKETTLADGKIELVYNKKKFGKASPQSLQSLVPVFNRQHPHYKQLKQAYIDAYAEYIKNTKDAAAIEKLLASITKDKIFKWMASGGNYATEIYTNGKSDQWKSDIMSNWWALQRYGKFWWHDEFPNGKLIMKLRIGDIVLVKKENADDKLKKQKSVGRWVMSQIENGHDLYFRVKKLTAGDIYLTPIHIAQENPDDSKSWKSSATSLMKSKAEKIIIPPLGFSE
jgi:hypothetical protein